MSLCASRDGPTQTDCLFMAVVFMDRLVLDKRDVCVITLTQSLGRGVSEGTFVTDSFCSDFHSVTTSHGRNPPAHIH